MTEYRVTLQDAAGNIVTEDRVEGLTAAKQRARYFLSADYAKQGETTHDALSTWKAEVSDTDGCVWDAFYQVR